MAPHVGRHLEGGQRRNHHAKEKTKVGQDYIAAEFGEAPKEYGNQLIEKGGCGKMKQDDMLREIMQLFSQGKKDQAFQEYPALTLRSHNDFREQDPSIYSSNNDNNNRGSNSCPAVVNRIVNQLG